MMVLLTAAMPVRIPVALPVINSVSILDVVLIVATAKVFVRSARLHRFNNGYPLLFRALALPLGASVLSLAWSQDPAATARSSLIYVEGIAAYLFMVMETERLPPARVLTYMKRFVYLLIIPGILLLLNVPGFEPQEPTVSHLSGDYISYYSRLSHPILGRSNNLATVLAFFVLPLLYWGTRHRARRFTTAGMVALIAVFLTLSRGVILALVACALLYPLFGIRHRWPANNRGLSLLRKGAAVGLIASAMATLYYFNPATNEFVADRLTTTTATQRWDFIAVALEKIAQSPLLGYGAGVTPDGDLTVGAAVHNTYVQQVLYYGLLIGVVVCISLFQVCAFFFSHLPKSDVARILGLSVLVQLLTFGVESSFEGTVLRVLFYLSVGLAVGLLRSVESAVEEYPNSGDRPDEPRSVDCSTGNVSITVNSPLASRTRRPRREAG